MTASHYLALEDIRNTLLPSAADTSQDAYIDQCITTASQRIDSYCGRTFQKTLEASPQIYTAPAGLLCLDVDDFWTTDDLVVKTGNDGTYGTTLAAYELEPVNGIGPNGQPGWPYRTVRLVNTFFLAPVPYGRQQTVEVTAKWGWTAIPDDVLMACRLLTHQFYRAKDFAFGSAGVDSGILFIRENPFISNLLSPYRLAGAFAGIA